MLVDNMVVVRVPAADRIEVLVVSIVAAAPAEVVADLSAAIGASVRVLLRMWEHQAS